MLNSAWRTLTVVKHIARLLFPFHALFARDTRRRVLFWQGEGFQSFFLFHGFNSPFVLLLRFFQRLYQLLCCVLLQSRRLRKISATFFATFCPSFSCIVVRARQLFLHAKGIRYLVSGCIRCFYKLIQICQNEKLRFGTRLFVYNRRAVSTLRVLHFARSLCVCFSRACLRSFSRNYRIVYSVFAFSEE